ncbi:conserved hypothetical protein [Paecilomyces variotii No. 5]|uniref:Uncharacterized protein n=1 Tax=Byssochlamys spectabilis (strain No. 5 / NBRC 109023) TaxID=1356009 RepID=V5GDS8_BYSSN|nr:conserved hypothetical protein [Paecilomyces variotii No. 5]
MFAALPHPTHFSLALQNSFHYAPVRSSPLAPRDANRASRMTVTMPESASSPSSQAPKSGVFSSAHTQNFDFNPSITFGNDGKENQTMFQFGDFSNTNTTPKPSAYAQRYASQVSSPASKVASRGNVSASETARAKRRDMFLNRVKRDREAGRLDARGEQLMMMEYMAEQKQWDEIMSRRADGILREYGLDEEVDEVEAEEGNDVGDEADVYALDEYISQEHEMEEALEELVPQNVPSSPRSERDSFYGDDDYDDIFMDLADHVNGAGQDMDMSG